MMIYKNWTTEGMLVTLENFDNITSIHALHMFWHAQNSFCLASYEHRLLYSVDQSSISLLAFVLGQGVKEQWMRDKSHEH